MLTHYGGSITGKPGLSQVFSVPSIEEGLAKERVPGTTKLQIREMLTFENNLTTTKVIYEQHF